MFFLLLIFGAALLAVILGSPVLGAGVAAVGLMLLLHGLWSGIRARRRRAPEAGFPYVYVRDDGTVRELSAEERTYLTTEFLPGDGARPHIKEFFEQRTATGQLRGFIARDRVPPAIVIE